MAAYVTATGNGSGRGRPPSLPENVMLTNRLLLQLGLLRKSFNMTHEHLLSIAEKVTALKFGPDCPHLSQREDGFPDICVCKTRLPVPSD